VSNKREDDKFLRKVIWFLGAAFLTSAGGWSYNIIVTQQNVIAQQKQIDANAQSVRELRQMQKELQSINANVVKLVGMSTVRTEIALKQQDQQEFIYGEQKRRRPLIDAVMPHINDRSLHK